MTVRWNVSLLLVFAGISLFSGCDFGVYNQRATERSIEIREAEEAEEEAKLAENEPTEEG